MNTMPLEQHNLYPYTPSYQSSPPYSATDYQAVHHAGKYQSIFHFLFEFSKKIQM
jgi:hypothetical protein